jgi:Fuc2NAc and GlcNAc transferase
MALHPLGLMTPALLLPLVFVAALLGTGMVRRYALVRSVLDVPNERSSHSVPTPRGGGVAMVVSFLLAIVALRLAGGVDRRVAIAILGAGGLVAGIGFVDDHRHVAARWRLAAHLAAACWALAALGGPPPLMIGGSVVSIGLAGAVVAAVALVWLLNLYNFMDGIDGIAGVEAVTVCIGGVVLAATNPVARAEWLPAGMLAAATLGFLAWNFPPARIFMGDAGSGFLGIILGIFALRAGTLSPNLLWSWGILLGVFVVDATVTLLRRTMRRERIYEAHRSHAYQHAAVRAGSHLPVTLVVGAINLLWLLPIALLAATGRLPAGAGVAIAYVPLIGLAFAFDAGVVRPPKRDVATGG